MNKYQEAIKDLRGYECNNCTGDLKDCGFTKCRYDLLQELVDKETGIKPTITDVLDNFKYGDCECKKYVFSGYNYCPKCGKKLDWSDK